MAAEIIDGKLLAQNLRAEIASGVAALKAEKGVTPAPIRPARRRSTRRLIFRCLVQGRPPLQSLKKIPISKMDIGIFEA